MRFLVTTLVLLVGLSQGLCAQTKSCHSGPIRVVVMDTGFGFKNLGHDAPLCEYGHRDFSIDKQFDTSYLTRVPIPRDTNGHGTNIAGLIDKYASFGTNRFCLVIVKYFSNKQTPDQNAKASIQAFKYVNNLRAEIVNYSGGGNDVIPSEEKSVKSILDSGTKIIAAAGNDGNLLDGIFKTFYPALYDRRITVVGNLDNSGNREYLSNYGPFVTTWEHGVNQTAYGLTMTGTSQATAIVTGKTVSKMARACDR